MPAMPAMIPLSPPLVPPGRGDTIATGSLRRCSIGRYRAILSAGTAARRTSANTPKSISTRS
ncbi:Uncharacterized protein pbN1_26110 [Aromatoleum bremense]|nr:Uncharacterized protein pbN1_26110 [Aromatoleum bremense]